MVQNKIFNDLVIYNKFNYPTYLKSKNLTRTFNKGKYRNLERIRTLYYEVLLLTDTCLICYEIYYNQ